MKSVLDTYCMLVDFLGQALGPHYEIALYDLRNGTNTIIAIANNHITGRTLGAPISDVALNMITSHYFEENQYKTNYSGFTTHKNKLLRTSTFFIKDRTNILLGMLCIYFDDSAYIDLSKQLLELCHPNLFISTHITQPTVPVSIDEKLPLTLSELIEDTLKEILQGKNIPIDQLTSKEKIHIVNVFQERGVFSIKGAVKEVAKALHTSEPTIYRYLNHQ